MATCVTRSLALTLQLYLEADLLERYFLMFVCSSLSIFVCVQMQVDVPQRHGGELS